MHYRKIVPLCFIILLQNGKYAVSGRDIISVSYFWSSIAASAGDDNAPMFYINPGASLVKIEAEMPGDEMKQQLFSKKVYYILKNH